MDNNTLALKFLLGKDINLVGIGVLKSKTLSQIEDVGHSLYNQYLSTLTISSDGIYDALDMDDDGPEINPFDFIVENCKANANFEQLIIDALTFFFEKNIVLDKGCFYIYEQHSNGGVDPIGQLTRSNFYFFTDILKLQNCVQEDKSDKNVKIRNAAQKEFFKKLKAQRKKHKAKNSNESDITDIISAVCAKHPSLNVLNIGDITMYQLIDQYKRLHAIDDYFISVKSLLAGCSKEDVKLTHWATKLSNNM